jgi:uncharacterized protein (DUF302 family)
MTERSFDGIVSKESPRSVPDTVDRLVSLIQSKDMKVFAVIDHSGEAEHLGLALRETKVVIFGSPVAGTPVMDAVPLIALDLPLKVLVWSEEGQCVVSYLSPEALAARYHLDPAEADRFAGLAALVDALVAD